MTYPYVALLLHELSHDTDMSIRPDPDWTKVENIEQINLQATVIYSQGKKVIETFACGEDTEVRALATRYGCQELHEFMNSAFDGELNEVFFLD